jgi:hypothetical protein
MDDMKKSAYLWARRSLIEEHDSWDYLETFSGQEGLSICSHLMEYMDDSYASIMDIFEVFPEFGDLFDGRKWMFNGSSYEVGRGEYWWFSKWLAPRLRIIDCIMTLHDS